MYSMQQELKKVQFRLTKRNTILFNKYDSDDALLLSYQVGPQRLSSTGTMSHTDFPVGSKRVQPSSAVRLARSSSPSNIGIDEYEVENSPKRFGERASPSNSVYDYRAIRDEELSERRRKHYLDGSQNRLNNGVEHQRPRALIDAYGKDSGDRSLNDKPLHVGRLSVNGLDHKATSMSWQNTEEDEFDWKSVGPSITKHTRSDDFFPSNVPHSRSYRPRPGLGTLNASSLDSDIGSTWSTQAYLPSEQSSVVAEDSVPPLSVRSLYLFKYLISLFAFQLFIIAYLMSCGGVSSIVWVQQVGSLCA